MKLGQAELERNQIRNKNLYNRKAKRIFQVFQVVDKALLLLPTDRNKLLMQQKARLKSRDAKVSVTKLKSIGK